MALNLKDAEVSVTPNPLDMVEEIILVNKWSCDRASDDEMVVEITGRWTDYRLYFVWHPVESALLFSCTFETEVPPKRIKDINQLIAQVNQRLWMGHFELTPEDNTPAFRHTLLMRGLSNASLEQMEDLVAVALSECERFYPALQLVMAKKMDAEDALIKSIFDVIGQA